MRKENPYARFAILTRQQYGFGCMRLHNNLYIQMIEVLVNKRDNNG